MIELLILFIVGSIWLGFTLLILFWIVVGIVYVIVAIYHMIRLAINPNFEKKKFRPRLIPWKKKVDEYPPGW